MLWYILVLVVANPLTVDNTDPKIQNDKEDTINKSLLLNWLYSSDKDLPLEELLKRYSPEEPYARIGRFCITDFKKGPDESLGLSQTDLMIVAADVAGLSGMGAVLKYGTDLDGSIAYSGMIMSWRS